MEFRRINALPPYVFATIDALKMDARRAGEDVIDLGFGNPDIPSPTVAVDKLCEAVRNPRNHRYSASRGIPKLRLAITDLYRRRFGVELDPDTQACTTIGAKEGYSHLMWTLLGPGDAALVPSPSYPIHIWGPIFAGAEVRHVRLGPEQDFFANLLEAWEQSWPRPRVIVLSFPHNPTTACVDLDFMTRMVAFAKEHDVLLVHDFAYADLGFDGYEPPSILQVPGAADVAVELTLVRVKVITGEREPAAKIHLERGVPGLALSLSGDVVQADVLAAHEHAVRLSVAVYVDAAVWILDDPGRNRRTVPGPQEAIVGARACRVLAVEYDAVLVEALVGVHPRGVGEISGNQQTPATIGVV